MRPSERRGNSGSARWGYDHCTNYFLAAPSDAAAPTSVSNAENLSRGAGIFTCLPLVHEPEANGFTSSCASNPFRARSVASRVGTGSREVLTVQGISRLLTSDRILLRTFAILPGLVRYESEQNENQTTAPDTRERRARASRREPAG